MKKILKAILGIFIIINLIPVLGGFLYPAANPERSFLDGYLWGFIIIGGLVILIIIAIVILILGSLVYDFIRWCFGYPPSNEGIISLIRTERL